MGEISAFFDMGGYAAFVWGAFGITALVLIGLLVFSARAARRKQCVLLQLQDDVGRDRGR